jgi:hypothetical protein
MNHFNFKSLTFYGIAIGSVLLLFKTVSAYGETNLKAPPKINNYYRLVVVDKIPNCEKPEKLILNIQQSGIYLNASLLPANTDSESLNSYVNKDSLSGIFTNQQLNLSGKVHRAMLCNIPASQNAPVHLVRMQMQLIKPGNLVGQFALSGSTRTFKFTAIPDKTQEKSQQVKSH